MVPLLVLAVLTAAPVKKVAAPGLSCVNIDPKVAQSYLEHFSQQLAIAGGFQVTSPQDIGAVLGLERQKQLLNCTDDASSCVSEIANALGVDAVILGTLSKAGSGYLVNVRLVSARDGTSLAVYSLRPHSDDELLNFLEASAKDFASKFGAVKPEAAATPVQVVTSAPPEPRASSQGPLPWVAGGVGVAGLIAGGVFVGLSRSTESDLRAGKGSSLAALNALASQGKTQETVGYTFLAVGVAAAATSAGLFLWGGETRVALVPISGGGALTMGGVLP